MCRSQTFSLGFAIVLALLSTRQVRADETVWDFDIIDDLPEKFKASGTLTSVDRSVPPNHFLPDNTAEIVGVNWQFSFHNLNWDWRILPTAVDNASHQSSVHLSGDHLHGPHPTKDLDPNLLEEANSDTANAAFGKPAVSLTASNRVPHPAAPRPHWDVYSIRNNVTALQGPDHMMTGPFEIKARHTAVEAESTITHELVKLVMGSTSASGGKVSYDAGSGQLTIHFGALDILNSAGSVSPGIETEFVGDPVLNTSIGDMTIPLFGPTGDGGYRFGGTELNLLDPERELSFRGGFSEYVIRNTSRAGPFDSFAIFDSLTIVDAGKCASAFADEFSATNVMGESIPDAEWLAIQGICLVFVTPQSLATLTGGFAFSVFDVPATVAISAARHTASVSAVPRAEPMAAPLVRSYPNPFQTRTTISYRVNQPEAGVRIEIFEPSGRLVRRLVEAPRQGIGDYAVEWDGTAADGRRVPSGIYFYRATIGSRTISNQLSLIR